MPQVHYPFIDVAVHPAVRARFAAGDAVVLFSRDMGDVLWANGEGARLFGHAAIYDMIEAGPERSGVAFRQLAAAAAQLETIGDKRGFMMRVTSGFRSTAVQAEVNLIVVGREQAVMFSAHSAVQNRDLPSLLSGFDDPDTHMALLGSQGEVLAASPGYAHVGVMPETMRALIAAVTRSADGLVKRPIPSGSGYLPAAIGRLADDLFLLFCVETSIGRMDAPDTELQPADAVLADNEVVHSAIVSEEADGRRDVPESDGADNSDSDVGTAALSEADRQADSVPQSEPAGIADAVIVADVEEGETATDLGDLAALDGASLEEVEMASSSAPGDAEAIDGMAAVDLTAASQGEPTELDADMATAAPADEPATAGGLDTWNTHDVPVLEEASSEADHDQPTELDADMAEASEEAASAPWHEAQEERAGEVLIGEHAEDAVGPDTAAAEDVGTGAAEAEAGDFDLTRRAAADAEGAETQDPEHAALEAVADQQNLQSPHLAVDADAIATGAVDYGSATGTAVEPQLADDVAPDHAEPMELDADIAEASDEGMPTDVQQVGENEVPDEVMDGAGRFADTDQVRGNDDVPPDASDVMASETSADEARQPAQVDAVADDRAPGADAASDGFEAIDGSMSALGAEQDAPLDVTDLESSDAASGDVVETLEAADAPEATSDAVTAVAATVDGDAAIDDAVEAEAPAASMLAESDMSATEVGQEERPFHFDRGARPIRFVWKLDANGVFAEVSEEFSRAVGPHAGDIVGRSFRELAALFGLDPEGQIASLLERRDTWSGRTVKWPVEGTDLVVPVDLAALPTYSRNREFDGFRGFGIIRVGDAESDPEGAGLKIAAAAARPVVPEEPADTDVTSKGTAPEPTDEFQGEVPALDIVSNPLASFADKVIQLEERRSRSLREGLSPSEQAALKEIARQLEPFGKRPNEDILKTSSGLLQTEESEDQAPGQSQDGLAHEGDAEIHATEEDAGDALEGFEASPPTLDEQKMQSLFEDLGNGPGLTPYAIDQVPLAILIHAGDRLIEMNAEFRRLTGYADVADLDRAGGLDALITRREGPDAGVYLVRADGTQVLVSARLQSVRYEGSSALMLALSPAVGTLAVAATEPEVIGESEPARRIAALQVEVEELRSILETATDGVIVLDTEGRIRSMNRSAAALFNFDDAEILGKPFAMLFAHESQKSVQDYLAGLAGHGVASVLNDGREVIGREASGGFIPLFMTMGRMPGSNSYCAVIRDITQWKRSEEELRTAKRAAETANQHKSDFLARVSHEIRTPLNAIIGFADMIATEHFGPAGHPRYAEYASDIGRSGRHVLDIVNDLLDISKIEAGEMDLEFAAVGLNDCVSEAVSLVQPQANAQRVIIRTALSQAVPDVVADLRSIKQIALNILANAIRYTPSGGQIVVSTSYEPTGSVTLRIRDTGVGMSKAELEQAMKPFGQVAPGTRQRGDGTGLGLPLTKAMTEANRATFAIHSAPNEGTLVEISFPPQRVLAD